MKTWGQWIESKKLYSFVVYENNQFRFSHWKQSDGTREDFVDRPLHKERACKFYIQFIF